MNAEYTLFALVNVFDITPAFLLPVFINDGKFYFQEIENDIIISFEEATVNEIFKCKLFQIKESINYKKGSRAVYAINSVNDLFFYGSVDMVDKTAMLFKLGHKDFSFRAALEQFHKIYDISHKNSVSYLIASAPVNIAPRSRISQYSNSSIPCYSAKMAYRRPYVYARKYGSINTTATKIIEEDDDIALCFYPQKTNGTATVKGIFELLKQLEAPVKQTGRMIYKYVKTSKDILKLSEQAFLLDVLLHVDAWRYGFEQPHYLYSEVELSLLLWEKFYNHALKSYEEKVLMQLNAWGIPVCNASDSEFLAYEIDATDWINDYLEENDDVRTLLTVVVKEISPDIRAFVVREHSNNDYHTISHIWCQCRREPYNDDTVISLLSSIIELYQELINMIFISSCDELGDEFSDELINLQNKNRGKCKILSMPGRVYVNPEDS